MVKKKKCSTLGSTMRL